MAKKTLKNFARQQAAEESQDTETTPPAAEETDTTETEEAEASEEAEAEETEKPAEAKATAKKTASANVLKSGQVAIGASELKTLRADAAEWNKNKGTFATLTDWHKTMKEAGAGLSTQDETTKTDKSASSVASQPWNQKAAAAYGKGKKD